MTADVRLAASCLKLEIACGVELRHDVDEAVACSGEMLGTERADMPRPQSTPEPRRWGDRAQFQFQVPSAPTMSQFQGNAELLC